MPSSVISFIQYNNKDHTLRVGYVSGMIYDYKQVPEAVYLEMKAAFSKGQFLNSRIKGHYAFDKIK